MRFWDSSAIVPLIIEEPSSRACRALLAADPVVIVWRLTGVEVVSAIRRLQRERRLDRAGAEFASERLAALGRSWAEVTAIDAVADRAIRLLGVHHLTAADALQLAAAVVLFDDRPEGRAFVTRDARLADEASRAGFTVFEP